jgi:hypothetical protein
MTWGKTAVRGFGSGVAAGAASAAVSGNLSRATLMQVGLDALGSTVGNAIANRAAASTPVNTMQRTWEVEDELQRRQLIAQEEAGRVPTPWSGKQYEAAAYVEGRTLDDIILTSGGEPGRVRNHAPVIIEQLPDEAGRITPSQTPSATVQRATWLEEVRKDKSSYYDGFRGSLPGDLFAEVGSILVDAGVGSIGGGLNTAFGILTDSSYRGELQSSASYAATHPDEVRAALKQSAVEWWESPVEDKLRSLATEGVASLASGGVGLVGKLKGVEVLARVVEKVPSAGPRLTQYGTTLEQEIAAVRGMSSPLPMSSLRQAYQEARGQIDFAHIEADVAFKSSGQIKAQGGHFSTSPQLQRIPGTETVASNGVIYGQVKLLGLDGNFYLKSNNGGFSSMTPDNWSLARAKGEMSQAWLSRSLDTVDQSWSGRSSGVDFMFYAPTKKVPVWRGYPVQSKE